METTMSDSHRDETSMAVRATASSAVGSALEWIDFTAYGAVSATVFPKLFFPSLEPSSALLASFATFGVGFFARPLGGVICGLLGDRLGRRYLLLATLIAMGLSSFLIGCLPTYGAIGIWAPIALVVLRIVQGFALGGESTGAQLMVMEHAPHEKRGLFGSLINIGSPISQVCANGLLLALSFFLTAEQFLSYGWRVPFLLSFVLVAVGIYIRLRVSETPAFEKEAAKPVAKQKRIPLLDVLRFYPGTVLRLMVVWFAPTAGFYTVTVFTLSYITHTLKMPGNVGFSMLMAANLIAVPLMIFGGWCSDRFGRRRTLLTGSVISLLSALAYFKMLDTMSWPIMFAAILVFLGALEFQTGVQPAYFAEPYPTKVRYSGSAISYTGANLIAGGPLPFIAAALMKVTNGNTLAITAFVSAIIVGSLVAIVIGPETRDFDLGRVDPRLSDQ
jgi:MFS family permease